MTLELVARLALVLYIVYIVGARREGLETRGSGALRVLNFSTSVAMVTVLVWAGWWS